MTVLGIVGSSLRERELGPHLGVSVATVILATALPLVVSTSLHGLAIATILFVASLGFAVADERTEPLKEPEPMRLVFLAVPGPGGGGGGGGLKMKTPPPKAERKGPQKISSPIPARKLPPPRSASTSPTPSATTSNSAAANPLDSRKMPIGREMWD